MEVPRYIAMVCLTTYVSIFTHSKLITSMADPHIHTSTETHLSIKLFSHTANHGTSNQVCQYERTTHCGHPCPSAFSPPILHCRQPRTLQAHTSRCTWLPLRRRHLRMPNRRRRSCQSPTSIQECTRRPTASLRLCRRQPMSRRYTYIHGQIKNAVHSNDAEIWRGMIVRTGSKRSRGNTRTLDQWPR